MNIHRWRKLEVGHVRAQCLVVPRFSQSLLLLEPLHWLPVVYRIKFNLAVVAYCTLSTQQLIYFVKLLHFSNIPRILRSSMFPNNVLFLKLSFILASVLSL